MESLSADVSITARPFFERRGFEVVTEQHPVTAGVRMTNFHMAKSLGAPKSAVKTPPFIAESHSGAPPKIRFTNAEMGQNSTTKSTRGSLVKTLSAMVFD